MTRLPISSMVRLGSGIVLSITLLFTILALATRGWIVSENGTSIGLFQAQYGAISIDGEKLIFLNSSLIY